MSQSTTVAPSRRRARHPVDQVPGAGRLAVYGFQHVLAFYAGAVVIPILLASAIGLSERELIHLINADLFTCGIASIIQSVGFWKVGVRLPLLQGVTFTAVSPMIAIGLAAGGGTEGLLVIYGSVIVAGLFTLLIAPYFSRLVRFFPPVVTGTVITIIGIALLPVAALDAVGGGGNADPANGHNLLYALGTLALIVVVQRVFRGFLATVAVLLGLVVGTLVAWLLGDASFAGVADTAWVGVTHPFFFGWPKFSIAAIISMIVVMLITAVETTGDVFAVGEIVDKRITRDDIARAVRADGLATALGGVLNSFPYTCFAENVGLVRLTQVKSRWIVAAAGGIMIVLGVLPKAGAVVASIPHPVLGGAALAMFATVAVVGFQTLARVDFTDHRNVVIVATSLALAVLLTVQPDIVKAVPGWAQIFMGSGITLGSITAIVLNAVFHHVGRGPAVARSAEGGEITLDDVNTMDSARFVATFSPLFQGPARVVENAFAHRPFADTDQLRAAFQNALFSGTPDQQREPLARYPALGDDADPHTPRDGATLDIGHLDEDEAADLAGITAAYRDRYGIPLIVCGHGRHDREALVRHARSRLQNSPAQEHVAALLEVAKIAGHRFDDLVADANPTTSVRSQPYGSAMS